MVIMNFILDEDEKIYAYTRTMGNEKFISNMQFIT